MQLILKKSTLILLNSGTFLIDNTIRNIFWNLLPQLVRMEFNELVLDNIETPPVPSLFRGFSAPVKLDFDYKDEELALLMAHDSDPFNQWEAGQRLSLKVILEAIECHQQGKSYSYSETFIDAFGVLLNNASRDPAFTTEALKLPGASYIAENLAVVDPEAIHQVCENLHRELALGYRPQFENILQSFEVSGPYQPDAESAGKRALTNTALSYLMASPNDEIANLCLHKVRSADNMTNAIAALSALAHSEHPLKVDALDFFYERWKHEALVLDKWFAVQASAPQNNTLDHVRSLLQHADFSMSNPNRVRSVIGVFCHGNHRNFHAADGSGYAFAAEQVIALDSTNAQIAARLARCFDRWRRFDESHQRHAEKALQTIIDSESLSKDTHEVVSRALS